MDSCTVETCARQQELAHKISCEDARLCWAAVPAQAGKIELAR